MNETYLGEEEGERGEVKILRFSPFTGVKMSSKISGFEASKQPGYGLRENPKKTRRFSDSNRSFKEMKACKECGKEFQSLKALCGHMACHSDKEKLVNKFEEENFRTSEKQKLVMDSHSDTETSAPNQRRASKRIRYKNIDVYSSLGNGSSSVSGIEQEQQEVAISLMMLSRDSGYRGGLNSFGESSDNYSIVLEAKSTSIDKIVGAKEKKKKGKDGKLKSAKLSVSENSDSGYFRNGPKKIESEVSVDGFLRNGEFKKLEVESGSGFEGYGAKLGNSVNKSQQVTSELAKNFLEEAKDQAGRGSSKYELRRRTRNGLYSPEFLVGSSCNKEANCSSNGEVCKTAQKRSKYECLTCNKTFHSHHALGGHRANHSKINGCCESTYGSGENSIETDTNPVPKKLPEINTGKRQKFQDFSGYVERKPAPKKVKAHECPICFRVFKSGQALGGHKRSHFVGGREDNTLVIRQGLPEAETKGLFDLNLPAPTEEDMNEDGFMAW
ncbi:hypothetical protein UlMin_041073 [Ulmus minor]